jgi:hypothetical protein
VGEGLVVGFLLVCWKCEEESVDDESEVRLKRE